MNAERNLDQLLATMEPVIVPGEFVFVSVSEGTIPDALATVYEPEGVTHVLRRHHADALGHHYEFVAAWIMLTVHSALDAVGLTAAVSGVLADAGISCNVIAGLHHDHLLVPTDRADESLRLLRSLTRRIVDTT
jgi:uncharacterized protein